MFEGSKLKVKRADQHISDFNESLQAFVKTDFYSFGIQRNAKTGDNLLQFKITRDIPCDIPLILGDAIHNLRAALDFAFVELITRLGKEPTKWSTFKIEESRDSFITKFSNGILKGEDAIITMFVDEIRAYEGGNVLLCALNDLDISDKHALLIPIFRVVRLLHVDADIRIGGSNITMRNCELSVGEGGVLNLISAPASGKTEIKSNGQPAFEVFFGKDTALQEEPIIPTLAKFSQLVSGILKIFEVALSKRCG